MVLTNLPIVMPIQIGLHQPWFLEGRILQGTVERFSRNPNFFVALADNFSNRVLGRRIYKEVPAIKNRIFLGAEDPLHLLLQVADRLGKDHILVIPENACGMPLAAADLIVKSVHDSEVDLAYCEEVTGLLPCLVSRNLLRKIAAKEKRSASPALRVLGYPTGLPGLPAPLALLLLKNGGKKNFRTGHPNVSFRLQAFCDQDDKVQPIHLFSRTLENAPIPYLPQGPRDRPLARHLHQHCELLESILGAVEALPVQEPSQLSMYFADYCADFAITYPTYELRGQSEIPLAIRGLTSNPKSVGECYFRAIHLTKLLKLHAGLRNVSRVLDVGCGWGLLALGLVNLIEEPGGYLGLDIQEEAIRWAKEYIAPLNKTFSFTHLDIASSLYNPAGAVSQANVRMPIESDSVDLVVFSSVFTHMRREGVEQYLKESQRILHKGGVVAFSYFHSSYFGDNESYKIRFPDNPDRMTLFSTREIHRILSACGLVQARPQVNYGVSSTSANPFFQTFVFATK